MRLRLFQLGRERRGGGKCFAPLFPHAKGGGEVSGEIPANFPHLLLSIINPPPTRRNCFLQAIGNFHLSLIMIYVMYTEYSMYCVFLWVYYHHFPLLISACVHGDSQIIRFRNAAFVIYRIFHMSSFHARSYSGIG